MGEMWKAIPGYEGLYEVSNLGRVRSVDRTEKCSNGFVRSRSGTELKSYPVEGGYLDVQLSKEHRHVHRLVHAIVAEAFIGPRPNGLVVRHLDGNPTNNAVTNLAYGTQSDNLRDWPNYGGRTSNQKLTIEQVREIRRMLTSGGTLRGIAAHFGVAPGTIFAIKKNRTFNYID